MLHPVALIALLVGSPPPDAPSAPAVRLALAGVHPSIDGASEQATPTGEDPLAPREASSEPPASSGQAGEGAPEATERPTDQASEPAPVAVSKPASTQASPPGAAKDKSNEKISIAVMDLAVGTGVSEELGGAITRTLTNDLEAMGLFQAVSTEEIRQMMELEAEKAVIGCDTAGCLAEIADALGAEYTVFGSALSLEGTYILQLQLVRAAEARTVAREQREVTGTPAQLLDEARGALKVLVRDVLALRSGTLDLSSHEDAATVKIDGVIVGVTPLPPVQLPGGYHTIALEKEGFVRFTRDVQVEQDETTRLDVVLQPSAAYKEAYLQRAWTWRILAWSGLAAGAVTLAASGGLAAWSVFSTFQLNGAISAYNADPALQTSTRYDELKAGASFLLLGELLAAGLAVVGLALGGAGGVAYLIGDDPWHFSDDDGGDAPPAAPSPPADSTGSVPSSSEEAAR